MTVAPESVTPGFVGFAAIVVVVIAVILLIIVTLPAVKNKREEAFVEE